MTDQPTFLRLPIIDTDSHVAEPPDLWTSRLASRWGDDIPRIFHDERRNEDRWLVGGRKITGVGNWASAGWPEFPPSHPRSVAEADPGAFEAPARLARMDEYGISAQVLYPNLLTFSIHAFLNMQDPQLKLDCVKAYNDFQIDFAAEAPNRFVTLTALPFWDVQESVKEIYRCYELGHRGVLLMSKPYKLDMPTLADPYWEPVLSAAQELGVSVNFHVGYQEFTEEDLRQAVGFKNTRLHHVKESSLSMIGLAEGLAEVLTSGLCHSYPDLKFVLVESGFGWVPFFLETLDWQWMNTGAQPAYPERELPSFYFNRQIFTTFWFEQGTVQRDGEAFADNLMFETDYPHNTSLSPGPASSARIPSEMAMTALHGTSEWFQRKVLYENAARLYDIDVSELLTPA